eukprot:gene10218-21305_t
MQNMKYHVFNVKYSLIISLVLYVYGTESFLYSPVIRGKIKCLLGISNNEEVFEGKKTYNNDQAASTSNSFGLSKSSSTSFSLKTHIIFGTNALEHGINMIEGDCKNVLVICGWNSARVDSLMWELEPRDFEIEVLHVPQEPTMQDVIDLWQSSMQHNADTIIAMGGASVMDAAKLATTILHSSHNLNNLEPQLSSMLRLMNYTNADNSLSIHNARLIAIPCIPCIGAELSHLSAISPMKSDIYASNNIFQFKSYINAITPKICLYQPSLFYTAPMYLLHHNLLSMIYFAIDHILSSSDGFTEMLSWNALEKLVPILDVAVESANTRSRLEFSDPISFHEVTKHDNLTDHRSQYFRRYGQELNNEIIEQMALAAVTLSSAKCTSKPLPLQFLVDMISVSTSSIDIPFISRVSFLAPKYFLELLNWSKVEKEEDNEHSIDDRNNSNNNNINNNDNIDMEEIGIPPTRLLTREEKRARLASQWKKTRRDMRGKLALEDKTDQEKSYMRNKLLRISTALQSSHTLSSTTSTTTPTTTLSDETLETRLVRQLDILGDLFYSITGPIAESGRRLSMSRLPEFVTKDCYLVRGAMRDVCGDVPACRLSTETLASLIASFNELSGEKLTDDVIADDDGMQARDVDAESDSDSDSDSDEGEEADEMIHDEEFNTICSVDSSSRHGDGNGDGEATTGYANTRRKSMNNRLAGLLAGNTKHFHGRPCSLLI